MNFFEAQYEAKKKTKHFLFLFISVVVLTSFAFGGFAAFVWRTHPRYIELGTSIAIGFSGFVFLVAVVKIFALRRNPEVICTGMGATKLYGRRSNPILNQYHNIVEEMSIASGVPVPSIYYLKDSSINAFACGFDIHSAAICITTGALEKLSRDEIQAIVAHEFSHILNGDMNINLKLTGALSGLFLIFQFGRTLMRTRSTSRKKNDAAGIGFVLFLIGGAGFIIGSWLKSKISREREYLADASSVQFTRNPSGMIGVFEKIMANVQGSILKNSKADDASHMCIAEATKAFMRFSTHPPLEERILAIDKNYKISKLSDSYLNELKTQMYEKQNTREVDKIKPKISQKKALESLIPMFLFMKNIPAQKTSGQGDLCTYLIAFLENKMDEVRSMEVGDKIKFLELVSPYLRDLKKEEKIKIKNELLNVIKKDGKIDFFEFTVYSYLNPSLEQKTIPLSYLGTKDFNHHGSHISSFLYYVGKNKDKSFTNIVSQFQLSFKFIPKEDLNYTDLSESLSKLRFSDPKDKEKLCHFIRAIIKLDGNITDKERLIYFSITGALGVPHSSLDN